MQIKHKIDVEVAELVDAHDSGSCGSRLEGSSPFFDINFFRAVKVRLYFSIQEIFAGSIVNDVIKFRLNILECLFCSLWTGLQGSI